MSDPTQHPVPDDGLLKEATMAALGDAWLVWSNEHNAWWRPKSRGYTDDIRAAGIYTHARAHEIVEQACPRANSTLRPGAHPEVAVTLASALDGFNDRETVGGLLCSALATSQAPARPEQGGKAEGENND